MSVMDIDVVFVPCQFINESVYTFVEAALNHSLDRDLITQVVISLLDKDDFVWGRVERDLSYEAEIIEEERIFWENYVLPKVAPPYMEKPDLVLQSLSNYYGHPDKEAPEVSLAAVHAELLVEYGILKDQKTKAKEAVEAIEQQMKQIQAAIVEEMGCCSVEIKKRVAQISEYVDNAIGVTLSVACAEGIESILIEERFDPDERVKRIDDLLVAEIGDPAHFPAHFVELLKKDYEVLQGIVASELTASAKATCVGHDGVKYIITHNPVVKEKFDNKRLRDELPEIYEEYSEKKVSHTLFSIKEDKPKGKTKAKAS